MPQIINLPTVPANRAEPMPTFRQVWLARRCRDWQRSDMRRRYWSVTRAARIAPRLDPERLQRAFRDVLVANPVLRWSFTGTGEEVRVEELSPHAFALEVVDASPSEILAQINRRAPDVMEHGGDPLVAITAYQTADATTLLLRFHHFVIDGWSVMLVVRELVSSYLGKTGAGVTGNFADFARYQREFVDSPCGQRQRQFWLDQLNDLPGPLPLPYDRPESGTHSTGGYVSTTLSPAHVFGVQEQARQFGTTSFRLMLAAFNVTVYAMTGVRDAPVACEVANRTRPEFLLTIGWLANGVHLRTPIVEHADVASYFRDVATHVDLGLEYQDYPVNLIEAEVLGQFPGVLTGLDQISFGAGHPRRADDLGISDLITRPPSVPLSWGGYNYEALPVDLVECARDLTMFVRETVNSDAHRSATSLHLNYRGDVFEHHTVLRILELYCHVLGAMVGGPRESIEHIVREARVAFPDVTRMAKGQA